eukprot:CAMPEP_0113878970 /NCGR_PEP_ID=MMETSP0780_2-20120614/6976_1 /TAXON_ID=652834 /ORGANISM="Palpitomonas bilix" /LENGTH=283 /DNA_ID=CAMNT_0000865495 /DNA_START=66 /DNA_END=917 /DNA_ORIENTATION=+ /assembly_acc=CAM_ASM_000599
MSVNIASILDCREVVSSADSIAVSVNIPWKDIENGHRSFELPAREDSFSVVFEHSLCKEEIERRADFLLSRSWTVDRWIPDEGEEFEFLQNKKNKEIDEVNYNILFRPNPFLMAAIDEIETSCGGGEIKAIDAGCGSGREMLYLTLRGWKVTGIDNRKMCCVRANKLCDIYGAKGSEALVKSVEDEQYFEGIASTADLLLILRFFPKESLQSLLSTLKPGGWLLLEWFRKGAEAFGHPKDPTRLLGEDDVSNLCATFKLQPKVVENVQLADGRPITRLAAIKL